MRGVHIDFLFKKLYRLIRQNRLSGD